MIPTRFSAPLLAAALLLTPLAAPAMAMSDLVVRESKLGVKETIDALTKAVEAKGIKVVARIDHAAGANVVDGVLNGGESHVLVPLGSFLRRADATLGGASRRIWRSCRPRR